MSEGIPDDVSDPDPLAFAGAPSNPPVVAQSSQGVTVAKDPGSENASSPVEVLSPGSVYRPEWGVTNEKRCAELDARLDALSIDFDEELYPHMLTAIAGRRWVIGHGLRLAMMK
nr:hypothetical protein [Tanacetum cinerariifolium]